MKSNMLHLRSVVFLFAFFFGSFGDSWGQCITWLGNEYNGDLSNVYVGDPIYFEIQTFQIDFY